MFGINRSKKSVLLSAVLAAAGVGAWYAVPVLAQQVPAQAPDKPAERPGQGGDRAGRGASLENSMKLMERSYKAIARQIDDSTKDEQTFKAISGLQSGAAASKGFIPHSVEDKAGDERVAAAAEFRKMLLDVLKTSIELEEALIAGKRDEAKAALAKIHEMEEAGHKKFQEEGHAHDHAEGEKPK